MAFFRYKGERSHPAVAKYGITKKIEVPHSSGVSLVVEAPNQETGFLAGDQIPQEITDSLSLLALRTDPRFEEVR